MGRLALSIITPMTVVAGLAGCLRIEQPDWDYIGTGSDDYQARRNRCTEFAIYQYPLNHFDEEMDEEEHQEENYGRPKSPRFERKFADCMERNDWRRVS